jgi:hypothetical protein
MQPPDFKNPYNVILIGEVHERDKEQIARTVTLYREQVYVSNTTLYLGKGSPTLVPILPLEEGGIKIDKCNSYNSIAKESFPSVLTGVFNLLQSLSILMYHFGIGARFDSCSKAGVDNELPTKCSTDNIKDEYFDVLVNMERTDRTRIKLQSLFEHENDLIECLNNVQNPDNKKKLVELFKTIHGRYDTLLKGTQYEQHRLQEYRINIPINGTREVLLVPIPHAENGTKTLGLLRNLQLDRDKLMVANLKKSIDDELGKAGVQWGMAECEGGGAAAVADSVCSGGGGAAAVEEGGSQLPRVNVVIVGNDHFVYMKKLLSEAPFRVIYENNTRISPTKFSIVEIRDLKSHPELNGLSGIIFDGMRFGADGSERWPIIVETVQAGVFVLKELSIKNDNFEVRQFKVSKDKLHHLFPHTHAEAATVLGKSYRGGGRKHHRKHSTRRSKTTKHYRKHITQRSKSTKRRFKRTKA